MTESGSRALDDFREALRREYAQRFSASAAYYARRDTALLDHTSHAIRWNEPFMPVTRRASGAAIETIDGRRLIDYWQGHFTNIWGHNPPRIRRALAETLEQGRGLQTGMIHEVEEEVAGLLHERIGCEAVRFTTSGSLGTFYATVLARAFTGRDRVLKVKGGWHGSQPFGLKGVAPHGVSFDHLESEGLSRSLDAEVLLTRFNDVDDLRAVFGREGDRIAAFLVEPVLGSGGGMVATREYLAEARRLTEAHGALLLADEIISGFRFGPGDLSARYGVRPDLWILGKALGGGMPLAAVAGRADVMALCSRESKRVKFEGGTYSAHELSLVAARTVLRQLVDSGDYTYARLATAGRRLRNDLLRLIESRGAPMCLLGGSEEMLPDSSLLLLHVMKDAGQVPGDPEALAAWRHPLVDEGLLKSVLMLEGLSIRTGLGAASTAHDGTDIEETIAAYSRALERLTKAGLF